MSQTDFYLPDPSPTSMSDSNCPYCQSDRQLATHAGPMGYYVECGECLARGPLGETDQSALDAWNAAHGRQHLLQSLLDASPDVILVKDDQCRFLMANEALARLYNATPADMIGKRDADFNDNEEQTRFFDENVQAVLARGEAEIVEESATDAVSGEVRYYRSLKKPIVLQPGSRKALLVIAHDITDLKLRLLDIAERERRYDYAMNAAGEGIWDWQIEQGVVRHNDTWGEILGYEDMSKHPMEFFSNLIHPDDAPAMEQRITEALQVSDTYESEHRLRCADGSYIWALDRGRVVERGADGQPLRMVGSFSDVTARREAEDSLRVVSRELEKTNARLEQLVSERTAELEALNLKLERMVRQDTLTGLANRFAAEDELATYFANLRDENQTFALMLVDIDHFKRVNDTYGHQVGDKALCHIAHEMSQVVNGGGFIARFGGEEFLILYPSTAPAESLSWAQNLVDSVAATRVPGPEEIHLTISIGLLFLDNGELAKREAIRRVDEYLYQAKADGRNCVRTQPE